MPIQCTCEQCGGAFSVKPHVVRDGGGRFCTIACKNAAQVIRAERPCMTCGSRFLPYPAEIRKGGGKFCGRPCYVASITIPLEVRFWAKVKKDGPIPEHCPELGACWEWTGARNEHGYGIIGDHRTPSGKARATHIALEFDGRSIPAGLDACHACDWPPCVNPAHLWHGTAAANLQDMVRKGRHPAAVKPAVVLKGEAVGTSRLTDSIVLESRRRYHAGEATIRALAEEHGICISGMRNAVSGKNWRHLPLHPR